MAETYIVVDIETSGRLVGKYDILSIGACVAFQKSKKFYVELKPLRGNYDKHAMRTNRLSLKKLTEHGTDPKEAMLKFERWIKRVCVKSTPVFVAFPATFDWPHVNYYFMTLLGRNPFDWTSKSFNVIEMRSFFAGRYDLKISEANRKRLYETFRPMVAHTHNALSDAMGYRECFEKMMKATKQ